jgi:hypothetical protein
MPSRKLKFFPAALLLAALVGFQLHANEGGEANEAPKDQGVPKDQKEFTEKSAKLNSLATRIEDAEKQFSELVRKKAGEKNQEAKEAIIKEMVEITNKRNKDADEYNKLKTDLTLRYPSQGVNLNRRYQTQTKKSVEEMEGAAGLDELLTRTKKIVEKKFAPFNTDADAAAKPKAKAAKPQEEKRERLRLEK